jgi:hypothetical protein
LGPVSNLDDLPEPLTENMGGSMRRFVAWFSLILLTGCGSLAARTLIPVSTLTAPVVSPVPIDMETAPAVEVECAFVWSNRTLVEEAQQVDAAFMEAGMSPVEVQASAYGEDCLDSETNQVVRFTPMQTDFYLTIPVESTADVQQMGDWVERSMRVLESFPPGQVPGPNPGYVGITFGDGTETVNLWFLRSQAKSLMDEGLRGGELFEALRSPAP